MAKYLHLVNSNLFCDGDPDCVDVSNEGQDNAEYDPSADTLSDVSLIETKGNADIEQNTDKGSDENASDVLISNSVIIASFSIIG